MKRLLTLALFAVLLLPAVAQELTVATYNIRNANKGDAERGNGWERRCPWVCGLIEFQGFDIFGSQEVLDGQLHDMLAQLPDYAYIGVGRDDGKQGGEHAPIFYKRNRFVVEKSGNFWIAEPEKMNIPGSKGWDSNYPRVTTWAVMLDKVSGDFNATPKDDPILVMTDPTNSQSLINTRRSAKFVYGPDWSFHDFGRIKPSERPWLDYIFVDRRWTALTCACRNITANCFPQTIVRC